MGEVGEVVGGEAEMGGDGGADGGEIGGVVEVFREWVGDEVWGRRLVWCVGFEQDAGRRDLLECVEDFCARWMEGTARDGKVGPHVGELTGDLCGAVEGVDEPSRGRWLSFEDFHQAAPSANAVNGERAAEFAGEVDLRFEDDGLGVERAAEVLSIEAAFADAGGWVFF